MPSIALAMLPDTPIGTITVALSPRGLVAVGVGTPSAEFKRLVARLPGIDGAAVTLDAAAGTPAIQQLAEYFAGRRRAFDLSIDESVLTDFQRLALGAVQAIPWGETRTYADIAREIGRPTAVRAVGRANATNPMPIVIPCHRVLGAGGTLHGYSAPGGIETKAWLLRHEGRALL